MNDSQIWTEDRTPEHTRDPLVAFAIHDGHAVRDEIAPLLALDDVGRLREEDPFTGAWTSVATIRVVGRVSRFQVDLNRPREKAVYQKPEDSWGLRVWKRDLPPAVVERSLAQYDAFYAYVKQLMDESVDRFGRVVVFDLHSYNHRRNGASASPASAEENPQVNLGTGTMDRSAWAPVVERFMDDLRAYDFPSGRLDIRENVKFRGGNLSRWIHQTYPNRVCSLAIEFKKFFMDEWTGQLHPEMSEAISAALASTVPGVLDQVRRLS